MDHAVQITFKFEPGLMWKWLADEFAAKRGQQLQQAIRKHGECKDASLPVAFLENSDKCKQNETGEKVLQNGEAWLPKLMDKVPQSFEHCLSGLTPTKLPLLPCLQNMV